MSKRWKRLLSILLFWMIFAILFAYAQDVVLPKQSAQDTSKLLNSLITPYTNATRTRAFEGLPPNTVDLAFIGSSTVFCSVNPVQLYRDHGIASHQFTVGAITGALTDYVCDLIFTRQSPRYVLLDATRLYADYLNTGVMNLMPMTKLTPAKVRLALGSGSLTKAVEYLVPLFGTHKNWINVTPADFRFTFSTREDPFLGMVGMVRPANNAEELRARFEKPAMENADFTPAVKPILTELGKKQTLVFRDKCLAHGAQPVIIVCPTVFGNEATQFLLALQAFAEDNGILMKSFTLDRQGLVLEAEDFADDHHLTVTGMEKFTTVLGAYLKANLDLPDRRGDPGYARYEESVVAYEDALRRLAQGKEAAR